MEKKPLNIIFYWHFHQPYYFDLVTGEFKLPWVILHSIKDYYYLGRLVKDFPEEHFTFNFVPSLIEQIEIYLRESFNVNDKFISTALKPATDLSDDDKLFLLKNFFFANWDKMINPIPRYKELLDKRGRFISKGILLDKIKYWTPQDFLDLQVLFHLCWFDPISVKENPFINSLKKKGKNFTEEEKVEMIRHEFRILEKVLPLYKELWNSGQVELTATPYYHPIMPLLYNSNSAKVEMPGWEPLRNTFSHPEDIDYHINAALCFFQERFGRKPRGMWPSEGSVSKDIIPIISKYGLEWIATDEEILSRSVNDGVKRNSLGEIENPEYLYRAFNLDIGEKPVNIIFRDHKLSDNFSFNYHQIPPNIAVNNFMKYLEKVYDKIPNDKYEYGLSVIMDGENAWEYYDNNGYDFLKGIFEKLRDDKRFELLTVSEFMDKPQEKPKLNHITSGSWINHNFYIWIGHNEDKKSWELLGEVRDDLTRILEKESGNYSDYHKHLAWKSFYVAEGSDWAWWYGEDQSTANDSDFDELFRTHLANIYRFLGKEVPSKLYQPISDSYKKVQILESVGFIEPVLDGIDSDYYEWLEAGYLDVRHSGGTMHRAETIITYIYFGFDKENLYLRIDTRESLKNIKLNNCRIEIVFINPDDFKIKMECRNIEGVPFEYRLFKKEEDQYLEKSVMNDSASAKDIIEMKIPLAEIGALPGHSLSFFILLWDDGNLIERAPEQGPINLLVPSEDFEKKHWRV
ncbi:MAG: glycoside hydrolase family 57 protein [bacterium]|nr:glycoside hydrolase family 57 protein [bacterium]